MGKTAKGTIEPKRKCCRDKPRCKRCPVVCKRLVKQGFAEKHADGHFVLSVTLTKKQYKAARGA